MNFRERAEQSGIRLSEVQEGQLVRLTRLLLEYNAHTNITGITLPEDVENKHYIDSAAALPFIPQNARLCDIGTGGGFPALPLAILRPDLSVTAIDGTGKKIAFVKHAAATLGLNVEAVNARAEEYMKSHSGEYDVLTFRAFSELSGIIGFAPLLNGGGRIIAYKGQEDKARGELESTGGKSLFKSEFHCYALPKGDKRTLVILSRR